MPATAEKPKAMILAPFGVEIDHPRNCDVVIQSIPGCRMRGRIKPITSTVQGTVMTPLLQGHAMPEVPGMQIHVNPAQCTYKIVDPLIDDDAAQQRLVNYLKATQGVSSDFKIRGVPEMKGELDIHRMKTLCRELYRMIAEGHARIVRGPSPNMDDIEDMPGKFLLNPGSRVANSQPAYEEDFPDWKTQLDMRGG